MGKGVGMCVEHRHPETLSARATRSDSLLHFTLLLYVYQWSGCN